MLIGRNGKENWRRQNHLAIRSINHPNVVTRRVIVKKKLRCIKTSVSLFVSHKDKFDFASETGEGGHEQWKPTQFTAAFNVSTWLLSDFRRTSRGRTYIPKFSTSSGAVQWQRKIIDPRPSTPGADSTPNSIRKLHISLAMNMHQLLFLKFEGKFPLNQPRWNCIQGT